MMTEQRERRLGRVFVELADSGADDLDIAVILDVLVARCVELLDVTAAGVVLVDDDGELSVAAASSERARLVGQLSLRIDDGPCRESVRTGQVVASVDLADEAHRWPRFAPQARAAGVRAVQVVPMRLRGTCIGALHLLNERAGAIDRHSVALGQAFADVATIGILHRRAIDRAEVLTDQLQHALESRIVIEQAKGVLAARTGVDVDKAFGIVRDYARSHNLRLTRLAGGIVDGTIDLDAVVSFRQQSRLNGC